VYIVHLKLNNSTIKIESLPRDGRAELSGGLRLQSQTQVAAAVAETVGEGRARCSAGNVLRVELGFWGGSPPTAIEASGRWWCGEASPRPWTANGVRAGGLPRGWRREEGG
jgi:hypothetical protein